MEYEKLFFLLAEYCQKATLENIEEIMKTVDEILTQIEENIYFSLADKIKYYMNILNSIYLEKMKQKGKLIPIVIDNFLYPSIN